MLVPLLVVGTQVLSVSGRNAKGWSECWMHYRNGVTIVGDESSCSTEHCDDGRGQLDWKDSTCGRYQGKDDSGKQVSVSGSGKEG